MHVGPVIVNSTPLVALWVLGRLDLLRELYDEVLIPQAVYEEFVATERAVRQAALENAPWIRPVLLANPRCARVYIGLDLGEAEVLALAEERAARLVIIDELKGRRYAQRLNPKDIAKLRALTGFPAPVAYLRDELDWPIEVEDVL